MITRKTLMFLLCGGSAAGVNWLARIGLSHWFRFEVAVIVSGAIGMLVGFLLYRAFVWPGARSPLLRQITGFIAVNTVSLALVAACAVAFVHLMELALAPSPVIEAVAHAAAIALGAFANFYGHGRVTFRPA